jgi:hypothetical protein
MIGNRRNEWSKVICRTEGAFADFIKYCGEVLVQRISTVPMFVTKVFDMF